jgi:tight adherence protein B
MLAFAVTIGFFAVIFLIAFIAVLVSAEVIDRRNRADGLAAAAAAATEGTSTLIREDRMSSISPFATILQKMDFIRIVQQTTMQAGLDWPVGRIAAMMLLCGTLAFAAFSIDWMPTILLLGLSAGATFIPYGYILRKRRKRFEAFEAQFPDAIDSLCRAVKAGHPFAAGMEVVATEPYQPVSGELRRTLEEWKLGLPWGQALENFAARMPLSDVQVFVSAVKLHIRTGGRLGEVLGRLAESMRENSAIRGEVRALATHGRMTGTILTILQLVLGGILMFVNPSQMFLLIMTPWGQDMIIVAVICLILAHFVIRKIVDIRMV